MPSGKEHILKSIRRQKLSPTELPNLDQQWIQYESPTQQFVQSIEMVGGRCLQVTTSGLPSAVAEIEFFRDAKKVVSNVSGVDSREVDIDAIDDPHDLEDVDFGIFHGQFGVAENGAIWVHDRDLKHRVIYFIVQHLALVIPASSIVNNMHEAYGRLEFTDNTFGTFIAGPSKTADIEQSLVIGAHGPRSLHVFVTEDE